MSIKLELSTKQLFEKAAYKSNSKHINLYLAMYIGPYIVNIQAVHVVRFWQRI